MLKIFKYFCLLFFISGCSSYSVYGDNRSSEDELDVVLLAAEAYAHNGELEKALSTLNEIDKDWLNNHEKFKVYMVKGYVYGLAGKLFDASLSYDSAAALEGISVDSKASALEYSAFFYYMQKKYLLSGMAVDELQELNLKLRTAILALGFTSYVNIRMCQFAEDYARELIRRDDRLKSISEDEWKYAISKCGMGSVVDSIGK